jgi:iron complex transport system substrate-binding protein
MMKPIHIARSIRVSISLFAAALLLSACGVTTAAPAPRPIPTASAAPAPTLAPPPATVSQNVTDGCVQTYDAATDYFPEKLTVSEAAGFTVKYFTNYKLVTVLTPWGGAKEAASYALVQCGTPAPSGLPANTLVVEVPAKRAVAMSTTYLPHFDKLGIVDRLTGLDSFLFASNKAVRALIDGGKLTEIGSGSTLNIEKAIALRPDLILTYGSGDPQYDSHPKLLEAGLKTVLVSEFLEPAPLGRAEWMKFTALFFNQEARATAAFDEVRTAYKNIAAKAKAAASKPAVLTDMPYKDTWTVPAAGSFSARLLADAGASYVFPDLEGTGGAPISLEKALEAGAKTDYWLLNYYVPYTDTAAVKEVDARFSGIRAMNQNGVWNNDLAANANGGNDYYESGVTNPHLVLADLVAIFHPELLPGHTFVYYRKLE